MDDESGDDEKDGLTSGGGVRSDVSLPLRMHAAVFAIVCLFYSFVHL